MHNFIIRLDPETRDELYSDASESFMGFLVLEAIYSILSVLRVGKIGTFETMDDCDLEQPDDVCQYDLSIDYLLDINKQLNEECGIFLDEKEYGFNSDAHEQIADKLGIAIISIEEFNDPGEIHSLDEVFQDPQIAKGFRFNALHLPDRIAFCIMPKGTPDTRPVSLADLIFDQDPGVAELKALFDPSKLSFQNALFNQRS